MFRFFFFFCGTAIKWSVPRERRWQPNNIQGTTRLKWHLSSSQCCWIMNIPSPSREQRPFIFLYPMLCFSNQPAFLLLIFFCLRRNFESSMGSFISFIRQEKNHFPLHLRNKWKAASQLDEAQRSLITCWCIWMRTRHPQPAHTHTLKHTQRFPKKNQIPVMENIPIKSKVHEF